MEAIAHRGHLVTPRADHSLLSEPDGVLVVDPSGRITYAGAWSGLRERPKPDHVLDHPGCLLVPGFVDAHVHLAQVFARARVAGTLLDWLEGAIFPAELAFADPDHAERAARAFVRDCVRNGVTTAAVFLTIHPEAAERAFRTVADAGLRAVMGLVHMDRRAPDALCAGIEPSLRAAEGLADRWHGHDDDRIRYALTPRFAPSCTPEMLDALGRLRAARPELHVHTHVSESPAEVEAVARDFPAARDYVDVYDRAGLLGDRTVLAHGIHLSDTELGVLSAQDVGVCHCPSSNFFLKSGVFAWDRQVAAGVRFGLGSDVGAGPEISPFRVMRDAYMIQPERFLAPAELLWRATLGGAQALGLDARIGSLEAAKDADFLVIDPAARPEIADAPPADLDSLLAALVFLGDDRVVREAYVRGRRLDA